MASTNEGNSRLKTASQELFKTVGDRAVGSVSSRVSGLTDRLEGIASGSGTTKIASEAAKSKMKGGSPITGATKGALSAVKDTVSGGGSESGGRISGALSTIKDKLPGRGSDSDGGKATDSTNIIEQVDVGVPVRVAYNQWTEFGGFPSFMKKVENVETEDDTKLEFKAQIFWSHRTWEATILEQVPDERIVWRSKGEKGHVDGSVTFHELAPNLTRILVVLEYYPQGFMEKTGNIWRAQGRRARAELKHFRRHVMTRTILDPDAVEGWRGTIEDGEVVISHEDALAQEREESDTESEQAPEESEDGGAPDAEAEDLDEGDEYEESDEDDSEEEDAEEDDVDYDETEDVEDDEADEDDESEEDESEDVEESEEDEDLDGEESDEASADLEDEDFEDEESEDAEDEDVVDEDVEEEPEAEEEPEPVRRRRAS